MHCLFAYLPIGFFLACSIKVVDAFVLRDKLRFGINPLTASLQTISGPWNATAFSATQCWGRCPLLMTKAFDTNSLPCWEDITTLACTSEENDSVTSRLIQHIPNTLDTYQVDFGPFEPSDLAENLKQNDKMSFTLVVNDVDRLIPPVSDWMDLYFDFLPRYVAAYTVKFHTSGSSHLFSLLSFFSDGVAMMPKSVWRLSVVELVHMLIIMMFS